MPRGQVRETEDSYRVALRSEDEFIKTSYKTIVVDKGKNIKAVVGKLQGDDKMTIQTVIFPKDKFTKAQAQSWVESHNMSHYYQKQLLYKGTFPHPQFPEQKIKMTDDELEEIANNTSRFLKAGGDIPVTLPPHPATPVEKINQTVGFLKDIIYREGEIEGLVELNDEAAEMIDSGKVRTVSPGIVHDVVTANGKFDKLVDHICITPHPHLISQKEFFPINAEKFNRAVLFFENGAIEYKPENSPLLNRILDVLTSIYEFVRPKENDGSGDEQEQGEQTMTEKEYQEKIDALKTENKTLKDENTTIKSENEGLKTKVGAFEKNKSDSELESFKGRIEKCISSGKMLPKERDGLIASYEALRTKVGDISFGDTKKNVADVLLSPYENQKDGTTTEVTLEGDMNKIRIDNKVFDFSTVEGRNEFSDYVQGVAEKDNIKYEEARKKVLANVERGGN